MKKSLLLASLFLGLSGCGVELGYPGGPGGSANNGQKGDGLRMFITDLKVQGSISVETADVRCGDDRNTPSSGSYKALLASSLRAPTALFQANKQYIRPDGTIIGKTNASKVLQSSLMNSIGEKSDLAWTGIARDFTAATSNCSNWSSNTNSFNGIAGSGTAKTNYTAASLSGVVCTAEQSLICVEI